MPPAAQGILLLMAQRYASEWILSEQGLHFARLEAHWKILVELEISRKLEMRLSNEACFFVHVSC